jgi:hypothetical protein
MRKTTGTLGAIVLALAGCATQRNYDSKVDMSETDSPSVLYREAPIDPLQNDALSYLARRAYDLTERSLDGELVDKLVRDTRTGKVHPELAADVFSGYAEGIDNSLERSAYDKALRDLVQGISED